MRFIFGIFVGAALTVGAAFVYDSATVPADAAASAEQRPMVNWDVVSKNARGLTARVRQEWNRLTAS